MFDEEQHGLLSQKLEDRMIQNALIQWSRPCDDLYLLSGKILADEGWVIFAS